MTTLNFVPHINGSGKMCTGPRKGREVCMFEYLPVCMACVAIHRLVSGHIAASEASIPSLCSESSDLG